MKQMCVRKLSRLFAFIVVSALAGFAQPPCLRSSKPDLEPIPRNAIGRGILPPRVVVKPEPEYDEESRKNQIQGTVILWVQLDASGKLKNVRPVESFGYSLKGSQDCSANDTKRCPLPAPLIREAVENVWHWEFEPACKDGHGIPTKLNVEVSFHLY